MKVLSVKGENLLSLGKFEVKFADSGLVLVEGWNYDDNRANGAGKTAIFNLLSLGLYQKFPRKMGISEILKHGEKRGHVEVSVLVGGSTYTATYGRPKRRVVSKDGVEIDVTQDEFESILGLNYDQFLTSMYTAQGGGNKFLDKNDTDKKNFLLELMSLNDFFVCRREAESKAKSLQKKIDEISVTREKAKSKIEVYGEYDIDETDLKCEIESVQMDIVNFNRELNKLNSIQKPDLSKFYEMEAKINAKKDHFAALRGRRHGVSAEYCYLDKHIVPFEKRDPDANCPSCSAELSVRNKTVALLDDQEALRKQHDAHMEDYKKQLAEKKKLLDEIDQELYQEASIKELERKLKIKKDSELTDYNEAQSRIRELSVTIKGKENKVNELKSQLKQLDEVREKVAKLKLFLSESSNKIEKLKKEESTYKEVAQMFSPTGAPAYVMDSIVETFNTAVNDHIALIWPSAHYELKSHKEKKTGDMVAKFSDVLIINGQQRSTGALSGGELRAFSLAIDFAVIDILSQQFGFPLNPIIMDEPFEGLDAAGREVVIELLEKLAVERQIWVVDHASESKAMFSDILRVEKRNGTSQIVDS